MTLFDSLPPSVAGSETSAAAAESIAPDVDRLQQRVLGYLRFMGSQGATDEELQTALAMNPSTERPRRIELVDMGLVRDSGTKRKTKSNRAAVVWVATKF